MCNVYVNYQNKSIPADIVFDIDWKRIGNLFMVLPTSNKIQLPSTTDFIKYSCGTKKMIRTVAAKNFLIQRVSLLKKFANSMHRMKCQEAKLLLLAIKWHITVGERMLALLDQMSAYETIARTELVLQCSRIQIICTISKPISKVSVIREINTVRSEDNRRTYLNIPQKAFSTLEDYSTRVFSRQSPYILVGLMR